VLGTLFAVTSAPALAAPVDKREREARTDFAAGRYQKAVDMFAQLFADTGDPLYLRNIGRCYQKMKRAQEAIDSFQEYLLKGKNLSQSERQEIDGFIKDMQALKASEAPPPPTPAVMPPPPPPPGPATTPRAGWGHDTACAAIGTTCDNAGERPAGSGRRRSRLAHRRHRHQPRAASR